MTNQLSDKDKDKLYKAIHQTLTEAMTQPQSDMEAILRGERLEFKWETREYSRREVKR